MAAPWEAYPEKVRSEILVHWTTPKSDNKPILPDDYVKHLMSIYKNGLWYCVPKLVDKVHGHNGEATVPQTGMICYTELRLSQVKTHTQKYGRLGIGFDRAFLMKGPGANPVFYVTNNDCGIPATNLPSIVEQMAEIEGLKKFLSYVKPMSKYRSKPNDLTYYDEMEWRMVDWKVLRDGDKKPIRSTKWHKIGRKGKPNKFVFEPKDVTIIIAPNEEVRIAILNNRKMKNIFKKHFPMMVTVEACSHF